MTEIRFQQGLWSIPGGNQTTPRL